MPNDRNPGESSHLAGLDSMRCYSAVAVLITHIELHKGYHGYANIWSLSGIQNLGPVGVYFFFTLSGFLITWLLKRDCHQPAGVLLKNFYCRRAARILPLYYVLLTVGFVVAPSIPFLSYSPRETGGAETVLFLLCQPHVASAFLPRVENISHLWSIGAELTFYLFWPFVVLHSKSLRRSILLFVAGMIGVKAGLLVAAPRLFANPQPWFHLAATLKFECMAIGAFFSLAFSDRVSAILNHRLTLWCCIAGIPGLFLLYGTLLDNVVHIPMAILFGIVIRSTSTSANSPVRFLDNRVAQFVGKISFGVYCWHVLCLSAVLNLLPPDAFSSTTFNLAVYGLVFAGTIGLSSVSYFGFEAPITAFVRRRTTVFRSHPHASPTGRSVRRAA